MRRGRDRITIDVTDAAPGQLSRALDALAEIPGIASYAPVAFLTPAELRDGGDEANPGIIEGIVVEQAAAHFREGERFAVRVNRADKGFPLKSDEFGRRLGAAIIERTGWQHVNLRRPDRAFHVDIYPEGAYIYADRRRGMGGLPVFSGGHVLSLLSGGIDSPVAAWMMAKRGCRVDFLHMTASHVRPEDAADNLVSRIARHLSRYTLRSRLLLLPYTHFDMALIGHERTGYEMILFRRFVARVGQRVAGILRARAMVAGDSLGQVASQTLENMVSASQASELPILRPLVGLDKQEIIDRARAIGTFDMCTEPYKDCCALLSTNPRTKSRHVHLESLEARVLPDYEGLIERTLADGRVLDFETGEITALDAPLSSTREAG